MIPYKVGDDVVCVADTQISENHSNVQDMIRKGQVYKVERIYHTDALGYVWVSANGVMVQNVLGSQPFGFRPDRFKPLQKTQSKQETTTELFRKLASRTGRDVSIPNDPIDLDRIKPRVPERV
jgi:hypothetical protein